MYVNVNGWNANVDEEVVESRVVKVIVKLNRSAVGRCRPCVNESRQSGCNGALKGRVVVVQMLVVL